MTTERALAAAQTVPRGSDVQANLTEHVRLIGVAADLGAALLVFPELSLTGYELHLSGELAFSDNDARLEPLQALANAHDMTLVVGAPVRLATGLHIGAFIISAGRSPSLYTKQRLGAFEPSVNPGGPMPPPEPSIFAKGTLDPLFAIDRYTCAVAICADTGDAAHARAAADRGANLYSASMFFTPPEVTAEHARLQSYAIRHDLLVIASNYGGSTGGLPAAGHSAIWSGDGTRVCCLEHAGVGVALAERRNSAWQGRAVAC